MAASTKILGVRINNLPLNRLFNLVFSEIKTKGKLKVMYANVHVLNQAVKDVALKKCLNNADIVYCDGEGVRLGARLLGCSIQERMTAADWIYNLCKRCQTDGIRLFLLGGRPEIAERASMKLISQYPSLKIVGTHYGHYPLFGSENKGIVNKINLSKPDILFVGFGTPLQEKWINQNADMLDIHIIWAVGALFEFVSGHVSRAPRWMTVYGLEWLFRLLVEPQRLFKRYIIGNPLFIYRILLQRLKLGNYSID